MMATPEQKRKRRERLQALEKKEPKLPRPCECEVPMRNRDEDGAPYCFRCGRGVPA